ncbi:MAG: Flp pilus assembly protein CpaB [Sphingobium sp.]
MDVKKAVLLAGALIFALVAALMSRSMFSGGGSQAPQAAAAAMPAQPDGPMVLVATKALPVGTIIDPASFRFQPWPKELIETAYFMKDKIDPATLTGSVIRTAITAGQPITQGAVIHPGDRGFLAAALGPGMRAVTVPVSVQSSVAGFIFPGDRVDVMLTQTVAGGGDGEPLKASETILHNLRVLATDQRTDAIGADGKPEVRTYSNVTLEVTPRMAEKMAVAQNVGQLSLSLRSIADTTADLDIAIAGGNVNLPNSNDPGAEKTALARIAAAPTDRGATLSTGADVSRFQRRTVPPKPPVNVVPIPTGPIVRIARGSTVEIVPVGGK